MPKKLYFVDSIYTGYETAERAGAEGGNPEVALSLIALGEGERDFRSGSVEGYITIDNDSYPRSTWSLAIKRMQEHPQRLRISNLSARFAFERE